MANPFSMSAVAGWPQYLAFCSAVNYHHPRDDPERKRERSPTTPHRHIHTHNKHIDSHRIKEK